MYPVAGRRRHESYVNVDLRSFHGLEVRRWRKRWINVEPEGQNFLIRLIFYWEWKYVQYTGKARKSQFPLLGRAAGESANVDF